jgi:hypothetical protein
MKQYKIYGIALIAGSLAMIVTMAFHPTGHDHMEGRMMLNKVVHSLAIATMPILIFGFLGFSNRVGSDKSTVQFAFITYTFGGFAVMCAAVINGLVAPSLFKDMTSSDEPTRQTLHLILDNNFYPNSAFAKVFVVATSTSMLCWSVAIIKRNGLARIAAIIGIVVGLFGIVGILSGHLRTNIHGFGLFILCQTVWNILIAVMLIHSKAEMRP